MSFVTRVTRRFTYPVESPFTSLTLYYLVLIGVAALTYQYIPILRPAITGARLMTMASDTSNIFADQAPVVASGTLSALIQIGGTAIIGARIH